MHHLVLKAPSGAVADTQLTLELEGRQVGLGARQQVQRKEPDGERQLGGFEHRAGEQGGLMAAIGALVVDLTIPFEGRVRGTGARRAAKTFGPASTEERLPALRLGTKLRRERRQRQTRLELHLVHRHDPPPIGCGYTLGAACLRS